MVAGGAAFAACLAAHLLRLPWEFEYPLRYGLVPIAAAGGAFWALRPKAKDLAGQAFGGALLQRALLVLCFWLFYDFLAIQTEPVTYYLAIFVLAAMATTFGNLIGLGARSLSR